ncbi:MAG: type II toxin-antitoxin system VapC family toxin [Pseudonocardiaceae bacterium]
MITFVLDTSAMVELFVRDEVDPDLRRRILAGSGVAPELIDLESANVLRRMVRRREIAPPEADEALGEIRDSPVTRIPHRPLISRVWELRETLTAYDAAYVALAELFAAPILTCDAKLARSNGHGAKIELYARA